MYFDGDMTIYPSNNIEIKWIYFVKECSFVFEFHSISQIKECQKYFSKKVHPSSAIPENKLHLYGGDHFEVQRWFERLPIKLFKEPKRIKILKALNLAIEEFEK